MRIVYGAGDTGKKTIEHLVKVMKIDYFSDKDTKRFEKASISGVPFLEASAIPKSGVAIIIAVDRFPYTEIIEELRARKINAQFYYYSIISNICCKITDISRWAGIFGKMREKYWSIIWNRKKQPVVYKNDMEVIAALPNAYYKNIFSHIPNFSKEYLYEIGGSYPGVILKNGALFMCDIESRYVNVRDGVRVSYYSPPEPCAKAYLVGDSRVFDLFAEDRFSLGSLLQLELSALGLDYQVVNKGTQSLFWEVYYDQVISLDIRPNDYVFLMMNSIVVTYGEETDFPPPGEQFIDVIIRLDRHCTERGAKFVYCDLAHVAELVNPSIYEKILAKKVTVDTQFLLDQNDVMAALNSSQNAESTSAAGRDHTTNLDTDQQSRRKRRLHDIGKDNMLSLLTSNSIRYINFREKVLCDRDIFVDQCHLTIKGNRLLIDLIKSVMIAGTSYNKDSGTTVKCQTMKNQYLMDTFLSSDLSDYIRDIRQHRTEGNNGAIVMNCNPFTNGHGYVIKKAKEMVDTLYIFVLEEDKSEFSFLERMEMVKAGVEGIPGVCVLPSGKFIISSATFPEYFNKSSLQNVKIDASDDIFIFSFFIAPALNIKYRFAGSEPFCAVTRQYNEQMRRFLPSYGIKFVEFDRARENGTEISASHVRRCLENKDFDAMCRIVPESTLSFLKNREMQKIESKIPVRSHS